MTVLQLHRVRSAAIEGDVTDPKAVKRCIADSCDALGNLDILACVAGGSLGSGSAITGCDQMSLDQWDAIFALNVRSAFLCAQAAIPHLKNSGAGRLIFTASSSVRTGGPRESSCAYVAAKGAVVALARRLAIELAPAGITSNVVAPGATLSERFVRDYLPKLEAEQFSRVPLRRAASVEEVAAAYVFLASEAASYITGVTLDVSGGASFG